jgi:DNA-binding transcriptional LysR family regulator
VSIPAERDFSRWTWRRCWISLTPHLVGEGSFVHEAIAHGGGIGGVPRLLAARSVEAGRLVAVLPEHRLALTRTLSFLHPATAFVPAKVRVFRDFLRETLAPRAPAKR